MSVEIPSREVDAKNRNKTALPPMFKVLMHNDDYSTMEFVIEVLQKVFHKGMADAERIMLTIHHKGVGVCGIFPFAVAECKVHRVHQMARDAGFPLRCSVEEA